MLASVPMPHFEGAQAISGRQEYFVVNIAFQRFLPIKVACIAPATFNKAFEFIVALTSIVDFQLIVGLFLNLNREGALHWLINHNGLFSFGLVSHTGIVGYFGLIGLGLIDLNGLIGLMGFISHTCRISLTGLINQISLPGLLVTSAS
jgi:hypothetical protein